MSNPSTPPPDKSISEADWEETPESVRAYVRKLVEKTERGQAIGIKDNMALVGILSTQLVIDQFIRGSRRERIHDAIGTGTPKVHC